MMMMMMMMMISIIIIMGFTCMNACTKYQVISLDSTSQATHVETCCYVV